MLSLHKLEIFAQVVAVGSFSAAAEGLYISQSAISQHIKDLEDALGVVLFKRNRRGVQLTPSGEMLYGYTRQILHLVAEAESAVMDVRQLRGGQLRLGTTPGLNIYAIPRWLGQFQAQYPQFNVSVQTAVTPQIIAEVLAHRLEIGLIEGEIPSPSPERLTSLDLQAIPYYVIVGPGHPWHGRASLDPQDLHGQPFVTRPKNSQTRVWLDRIMEGWGISPRVVAEFDNPESIKNAVLSGMGVAILPEYAIQGAALHPLSLEGHPLCRTLKCIWDAERSLHPIARAFLGELSAIFPVLSAYR